MSLPGFPGQTTTQLAPHSAITNLLRQYGRGVPVGYIVNRLGMPSAVVDEHLKRLEAENVITRQGGSVALTGRRGGE